jgi:pimeloyl-ACP methyl ester carboxylesterase
MRWYVMQYINVGKENSRDINLHYEDHGTGKPVVLIHGWPLNGGSWEKQESALLEAGYRVVSYDRRGFGESSKPSRGYDYNTFASDLDTILKTLDLNYVTLVGFSMGSGEVTRYLSTYGSDRIEKAALLASIPPYLLKTPDNPMGVDKNVFDSIMEAIKTDRLAYLTQFFQDFYNMDVLGGKLISEQYYQYSWNVASQASPTGTYECVKAWLTDFRDDLNYIDVPTLIMHGDADRILPIDVTGRRLKDAVKNSKYLEVKDGPHGMIWTHANEINNALIDFLQ